MGIGPVGESWAFVAVGDGWMLGHGRAHFFGTLRRHLPDDHGVGAEARAPVVKHGAVAAHNLPLLEFDSQGQQLRRGHPQPRCHAVERPFDQVQVFL